MPLLATLSLQNSHHLHSHRVGLVFHQNAAQQVEVALRLRRYPSHDMDHVVIEEFPRPQLKFPLPDGGVTVEAHRQMVLYQKSFFHTQ